MPESETGSLTGLPSYEISAPPISDQWPGSWISSLLASRARHSLLQASGLGLPTNAISGPTHSEPLMRWDPQSSCWRTSRGWEPPTGSVSSYLKRYGNAVYLTRTILSRTQGASTVVTSRLAETRTWEQWSGSFPPSGMTVGGALYPLPPLVHRISEGAGGVWPTPQTTDAPDGGGPPNKNAKTKRWKGLNSLGQMAKHGMWATATARDSCTHKGSAPMPNHQGGTNLVQVVGGMLNPRWVEWLMGLPIGWLSLEPLAMGSYQHPSPSSSNAYRQWFESMKSLLAML